MGNAKPYADCGEPQLRLDGLWYVLMNGGYKPAYYLVNRARGTSPYVTLEKDLENSFSGIYFINEQEAQEAIDAYRRYHGEQVNYVQEYGNVLESQVMRFN